VARIKHQRPQPLTVIAGRIEAANLGEPFKLAPCW